MIKTNPESRKYFVIYDVRILAYTLQILTSIIVTDTLVLCISLGTLILCFRSSLSRCRTKNYSWHKKVRVKLWPRLSHDATNNNVSIVRHSCTYAEVDCVRRINRSFSQCEILVGVLWAEEKEGTKDFSMFLSSMSALTGMLSTDALTRVRVNLGLCYIQSTTPPYTGDELTAHNELVGERNTGDVHSCWIMPRTFWGNQRWTLDTALGKHFGTIL